MSAARSVVVDSAVQGARRLLAALTDEPPPEAPAVDLPSVLARLRDGDGSDGGTDGRGGDGAARAVLLGMVHARTLAVRVAQAKAEDSVDVVIADGSLMSRSDVERALALKEESRVYPPLRTPLAKARRRAFDPTASRLAFDDAVTAHGLGPAAGRDAEVAWLRSFLAGTADLASAAVDVLSGVAGPIEDAAMLARALDRPSPEHGSDVVAVEIARAIRVCLPRDVGPLQRRAAPRIMAGHVVDDGDVVRVLWCPSLRLGRQRALVDGLGRAWARLAGLDGDGVGAGLGAAIGLLALAPAVRRAVGASSSLAVSLWRETVAASLLQARLAAAVAVGVFDVKVDDDTPARDAWMIRRDAARSAARAAVGLTGLDPGADLVDELLAPPWPDGVIDHDAHSATLAAARRAAGAAVLALTIRDIADEGALLRAERLQLVKEARANAEPTTATDSAAGWRLLLGEVA